MTKLKDELTKVDFRKLIFTSNTKVRKKFKEFFSHEIENFIEAVFVAFKAYKLFDEGCKGDEQKSWTAAFLFNAVSNLVNSFNLLISGYLVASGNLMRHFMESSAMAILVSSKGLGYFEEFAKGGNRFRVHKSLILVSRNLSKLKVKRKSWDKFMKLKKFYDLSSHPSAFALASTFNFSRRGEVHIGAHFDPAKLMPYRKEIKGRISAAECLKNIIDGIETYTK